MIATIDIQATSSHHTRISTAATVKQYNRPTNEAAQPVAFDLSSESIDPFGHHREYFQGNDYY